MAYMIYIWVTDFLGCGSKQKAFKKTPRASHSSAAEFLPVTHIHFDQHKLKILSGVTVKRYPKGKKIKYLTNITVKKCKFLKVVWTQP